MLMGTYERAGVPWSPVQTPWDFGQNLLPNDLERIAPSLEVGFEHFPTLGEAGIRKVVNGPFTFAPDGNPLIGPVKGLRNFWVDSWIDFEAVPAAFCSACLATLAASSLELFAISSSTTMESACSFHNDDIFWLRFNSSSSVRMRPAIDTSRISVRATSARRLFSSRNAAL